MKIFDVNAHLTRDGEAIKRTQYIDDSFLARLKDDRERSSAPAGDFHKAASIPVAVHEHWLRQGYDCTKAPIRETLKRLRSEGLHEFITTNKNL